jgi:hypothetical protein
MFESQRSKDVPMVLAVRRKGTSGWGKMQMHEPNSSGRGHGLEGSE